MKKMKKIVCEIARIPFNLISTLTKCVSFIFYVAYDIFDAISVLVGVVNENLEHIGNE